MTWGSGFRGREGSGVGGSVMTAYLAALLGFGLTERPTQSLHREAETLEAPMH